MPKAHLPSIKIVVKNGIVNNYATSGSVGGYQWIDLGLPSGNKWADRNIGANSSNTAGGYYSWGETSTRSYYAWNYYKYNSSYDYSGRTLTKYCTDSYYGTVDEKVSLELIDDVATQNWGTEWRIPTKSDFQELLNYCTWTCVIDVSQNGYIVTSKVNGCSIFLPHYGWASAGARLEGGCYWSSTLSEQSNKAYYFVCSHNINTGKNIIMIDSVDRCIGFQIRPITTSSSSSAKALYLYSNGCNKPNKYIYSNSTTTTITAVPQNCQRFVRWSDGNTDNPRTILLSSDTTFTAVFAPNCFTITATSIHGTVTGSGTYNYGATAALTATNSDRYSFQTWSDGVTDNPRSIVVTQDSTFTAEFAKQIDSTQIIDVAVYGDCSQNGYNKDLTHIAAVNSSSGRTSCEWVQLWENGPKWATFNVGATITNYANLTIGEDPIAFSGYTKQAPYYNTANVGGLYPWNNPNINGRTTTWKSTTGIADVATTIWGNNWETPTSKQLDTLLVDITYGKTTWTWCDGNMVQYVAGCVLKGYKVSGVGDYAQFSIFLPAAGYYDKSSGKIAYASSYGKYWSGSVSYSGSSYDYLYFYTGYRVMASNRENGNSVRAVLADNTVPTDNVTLTLKANDCETYNVITCIKEQPLRITATDSECSKFVRWSDGNTDNPRVVSINGNCAYTAIFDKINYTITLDADEKKGTVVEEK